MASVAGDRRNAAAIAGAAFGLVLGLALGATAGHVLFPATVAPPVPAPHDVHAGARGLVVQPSDVTGDYNLFVESPPPDPANTHPLDHYGVVLRRPDEPGYLTESDVSIYRSAASAETALRALLGVGKFGVELPLHGALGEEAHLYAAKDQGVVVGSVLWRDRNVVAWVFVYNPYPDSTAAGEVDTLARGNAYDDTLGYAAIVEKHIAAV